MKASYYPMTGMTVFFMRFYTSMRTEDCGLWTEGRRVPGSPCHPSPVTHHLLLRRAFILFCFLFSVLSPQSSAFAAGIAVRKADAHFSDSSYQLSAEFDISFNFVVEQALTQGVPLYFFSEFALTRPRWYWMDEVVAQSEQTIKLSYNSLTRQYRITRGSLFQNFASLDDAINIIRYQSATPIPAELLRGGGGYIAEKLLRRDNNYIAAARMHLDVTQLPKPLQVNALTNNDWNLDSDWYRWIVRPDTAAHNQSE